MSPCSQSSPCLSSRHRPWSSHQLNRWRAGQKKSQKRRQLGGDFVQLGEDRCLGGQAPAPCPGAVQVDTGEWPGQRAHSFARVRDTGRRNASPVAKPRATPSLSATLPGLVPERQSATPVMGICARAARVAASVSRSTRGPAEKVSSAQPARPAAPPLRVSRRALQALLQQRAWASHQQWTVSRRRTARKGPTPARPF